MSNYLLKNNFCWPVLWFHFIRIY